MAGPFVGAARGVLFDYGNVLARVHVGDLAAIVRSAGGAGDEAAAGAAFGDAFRAHDAVLGAGGSHAEGWRALMAALVAAAWSDGASPETTAAVVDTIWERQRRTNLWCDVPDDARRLVADLDAVGVPLAIVSNAEGRAVETIAEAGLDGHFAAIVDSAVVGIAKPDPQIFAIAAERLGLPLAALVHVGDSESADVVGALAAGARAIRFDGIAPNGQPSVADAVARDYGELRAALETALGRALPAG